MSKLLKCPFCGKMAELRHDKDGFSYIVCANDGCYVRTDGHLNEESAINNWNTRTPIDNIVEKLEAESNKKHNKERDVLCKIANASYSAGVEYAINIVKQEINKEN